MKKSAATPQSASKPLSDAALALIAAKFRALGEPRRLRMLSALMEGELSVTQLMEASGASQANASKHLAALRAAGMVESRKEGLHTLCRIADPSVRSLCEIMCQRLREEHARRAEELDF